MSGNLTHNPADILRKLMIDQGLGSMYVNATTAWAIRTNETSDKPDSAIFLMDTTGVKHGKFMVGGEVQESPGVQMLVRATTQETAGAKARTIVTTLDGLTNQTVTISTSTYTVYSISRSGNADYIGSEGPPSMRHVYLVNVTLTVYET